MVTPHREAENQEQEELVVGNILKNASVKRMVPIEKLKTVSTTSNKTIYN